MPNLILELFTVFSGIELMTDKQTINDLTNPAWFTSGLTKISSVQCQNKILQILPLLQPNFVFDTMQIKINVIRCNDSF